MTLVTAKVINYDNVNCGKVWSHILATARFLYYLLIGVKLSNINLKSNQYTLYYWKSRINNKYKINSTIYPDREKVQYCDSLATFSLALALDLKYLFKPWPRGSWPWPREFWPYKSILIITITDVHTAACLLSYRITDLDLFQLG